MEKPRAEATPDAGSRSPPEGRRPTDFTTTTRGANLVARARAECAGTKGTSAQGTIFTSSMLTEPHKRLLNDLGTKLRNGLRNRPSETTPFRSPPETGVHTQNRPFRFKPLNQGVFF